MDDLSERLVLNGIDGETGTYAVEPLSPDEVEAEVQRNDADPTHIQELRTLAERRATGTMEWEEDRKDIRQVGWAVVIHKDTPQDVVKAVHRLYLHRSKEVPSDRLKWLSYPSEKSNQPQQDYRSWLNDHGVGAGSSDPTLVPYYLLIVGSPALIPYAFSQGLNEHAVGRLDFAGAAEYEAYVESVIAYETGTPDPVGRELTFFAPRHELDLPTQASYDHLVAPMAGMAGVAESRALAEANGWRTRTLMGQDAIRANLLDVLTPAAGTPASGLLFTASHGMTFAPNHSKQAELQGAILCHDWTGMGAKERTMYLAGEDVPAEARLRGRIAFMFACFSGGTPHEDRFLHVGDSPRRLANAPFTSALPRRLLAHPAGGALACVTHIDRAWISAFRRDKITTQLKPFQVALKNLMQGLPVGYALRFFTHRYAEVSKDLATKLEHRDALIPVTHTDLTWTWVERNDAEGYAILGDPAVRLRPEALV